MPRASRPRLLRAWGHRGGEVRTLAPSHAASPLTTYAALPSLMPVRQGTAQGLISPAHPSPTSTPFPGRVAPRSPSTGRRCSGKRCKGDALWRSRRAVRGPFHTRGRLQSDRRRIDELAHPLHKCIVYYVVMSLSSYLSTERIATGRVLQISTRSPGTVRT